MATYAIVFVIVETLEESVISHSSKANTKSLLLWRPETEPKKLEQDLKGRHIDEATFLVKDTGKNIVTSCSHQQRTGTWSIVLTDSFHVLRILPAVAKTIT